MRGLIWLTLSLLIALAVALAWLVSTEPGARWLAGQADDAVPALSVGSVSGSVIDQLELTDLQWTDAQGTYSVSELALDWQPSCLRRWTFCVERLVLEDLVVDRRAASRQPEGTITTAPPARGLGLPLDVDVQSLSIEAGVLRTAGRQFVYDHLDARFSLRDATLAIESLSVAGPAGQASAEGEFLLKDDWPLAASLHAEPSAHLTEGRVLTASAELSGRAGALDVEGTLRGLETGPVDLSLSLALLEQPLVVEAEARAEGGRLKADARLGESLTVAADLQAPDLAVFWPGLEGALSGTMDVSGDVHAPRIRADLLARDVRYAGSALTTGSLAGFWDAEAGGDLTLAVDGLQYEDQALGQLEASLEGKPSAHQFTLALAGGPVPVEVQLEGGIAPDSWQWQGHVLGATAKLPDGRWRLEDQPALELDPAERSVQLAGHCWAREAYRVCAERLTASPSEAQLRLASEAVDLVVVERWLPADLGLPGEVSGTADLDWRAGQPPEARLTLVTENSQVRLPQPAGAEPLALDYDRVVVDADLRPASATLRVGIAADDLGRGGFSVSFDPTVAMENAEATSVNGTVWLDALPLTPLAGLLPQVRGVAGALRANGELTGALGSPAFQGRIALRDGRLRPAAISTPLESIDLEAVIEGRRAVIDGRFVAGEGQATVSGDIDWSTGQAEGAINLVGEGLEIEQGPSVALQVDPSLRLALEPEVIRLSGEVDVPYGRLRLVGGSPNATRVSGDAVRVGGVGEQQARAEAAGMGARSLESEIRVVLGDDVRFEGFGAAGGLNGEVRLQQLGGETVEGEGVIELVDARYQAYGQDLRVRRGRIIFSGPLSDPRLDIEAVREGEQMMAGVRVDGSARSPGITLFSTPPMEQVDILAYLLTGRPPGEESPSETALLGQAALSLGVLGGESAGQALADELGIEGFQLEAGGEGEQAQVAVSGYIAPNLLVRYGVGVFEPDDTLSLRYYLSQQFYLEAISGTESALDIFYTFDYD
ncbi:hypothetical protein SPISAL_02440 [Spiribacter salinus M19-40]|uniref:Translocation and assembly module TamB C-terminal domain-containing protein n=1 Tax=Spiribacter salinus M19-40 TaxID=1260251 RepID=R4VLU6_9GAMM|nr:translocation/assembly module TamB domain-containing protein [Spiribacter salinus]AGM40583.1 hypothetical protein SPISAL_02440 [Spiribacter salinus M19-40]